MRYVKIFFLITILYTAGCACGPDYRQPDSNVPINYVSYQSDKSIKEGEIQQWWKRLNDPELNSLVERAIASNFNLDMALTRLQQSRSYESIVLGMALPITDASASTARGTGSDLTRGRADAPLRSADNGSGLPQINSIAGLSATLDLDFFGKYRRAFEAARYDSQAELAMRNGVLTVVIADVVRNYIDLRGFQMQLLVIREANKVFLDSLRIVSLRYQHGISNSLDVALDQREFDAFKSQISPLKSQVNSSEYALALLLGKFPEEISEELSRPEMMPVLPEIIAPGAPLDLLKRRPDIQESERELAAATARVGIATASLYPDISLIGSIGGQSQGNVFSPNSSRHIWSFGPAALWPTLDFGSLDAALEIAKYQVHLQLDNYRQTILNAVREVDVAYESYSAQQDAIKNLEDGLTYGQQAVELATERYDRGLTDFLNVVDAERELYDLKQKYVEAQITQGEKFVELYKSLGGGWENYQDIPAVRRPQPAVVAAFRCLVSK